jgi:PAS domain S-box-containing protein
MAQRPPKKSPPLVHLTNVRFFGLLFRNAACGAVVTSLDGTITHANPTAEKLLGWGPGELLGQPITVLIPPGRATVSYDQVEAAGGTWVGEIEHRRKSGAIVPTRLALSIVRDDADEPIALLGLLQDDTPNQRQRSRLSSLVALSAALNAETDLDALLTLICQTARLLFSVDGVYLSRLDEQTQELVGVMGEGRFADRIAGQRVSIVDLQNPVGIAVRERRPVIANGVTPGGEYKEQIEAFGVRASLLAPLVRGERVLGLLALNDNQRPDRFSAEDAELAQSFAEIAAAALADARAHAAERAKSERLLTLARVCQLLTSSLETDDVFEAISDGAQRLLDIDEVRIWLLESPSGPLRLAYSCPRRQKLPPLLDFKHSRVGAVVRQAEPWQIPDVWDDPHYSWEHTRERQLHACVIVPLIVKGQSLGAISLLSQRVRTFDPEEVELTQTFGHQAAIAVRNAQTLARERQVSRFEALIERTKALPPRDRHCVENALAAVERMVELAARPDPGYVRALLDGRWLQDAPIRDSDQSEVS